MSWPIIRAILFLLFYSHRPLTTFCLRKLPKKIIFDIFHDTIFFINSYNIFYFFQQQHRIELNWTETPKIGDGKVYPPPCFSSTDTGLDSKLQISYIRMCRKNARRAHKNANNISPVHIRNRKPAFETIRKSIRIDYEHICVKISPILTLFCRVRVRVIWALLSPSFAYIQCLNWSFNAWHSIF